MAKGKECKAYVNFSVSGFPSEGTAIEYAAGIVLDLNTLCYITNFNTPDGAAFTCKTSCDAFRDEKGTHESCLREKLEEAGLSGSVSLKGDCLKKSP